MMGSGAAPKTAVLVWSCLVLLLLTPTDVHCIQLACSACRAVGRELQHRLDHEKPRNHVDLRHRLDKDGNRYGKVIDYKISELRVIEMLESLCDEMDHYEVAYVKGFGDEPNFWRWVKTSGAGGKPVDDQFKQTSPAAKKENKRDLSAYCGKMVEKYEDELTKALREETSDKLDDLLCVYLTDTCKKSLDKRSNGTDDSSDGVLPPPDASQVLLEKMMAGESEMDASELDLSQLEFGDALKGKKLKFGKHPGAEKADLEAFKARTRARQQASRKKRTKPQKAKSELRKL